MENRGEVTSIVIGAVCAAFIKGDIESCRQSALSMGTHLRIEITGKLKGIDDWILDCLHAIVLIGFVEEIKVEVRVMSDNDIVAEELFDDFQSVFDVLSFIDHLLGDVRNGDCKARDFSVRIDEKVDFIDNLSCHVDFDSTEFNQTIISAGKAGRFRIEDDKVSIA